MDGAAGYAGEYARLSGLVEARLRSFLTAAPAPRLNEAMRYSLYAGGKRVRAVLTLAFHDACGGAGDGALDAACAVEMLHTYSLIHDDLPCMDDDDLRRGQPSNHVRFGEWLAVLAGDALQAAAFDALLNAELPPERVLRCARLLSGAAGERGICAGQTMDMQAEERGSATEDELLAIHSSKTAALVEAACLIGVAAAGAFGESEAAALEYARNVGLAFQIRDDVLDATAETETLGKPSGSDGRQGKTTFYTLYGEERCGRLVAEHTERAVRAADAAFGERGGFLIWLAESLAVRDR